MHRRFTKQEPNHLSYFMRKYEFERKESFKFQFQSFFVLQTYKV